MVMGSRIAMYPKVIQDVLVNPGTGFMTFQRFNGDQLNPGTRHWTEGHPIEYQSYSGSLENVDYPMTSLAYYRVYWKYLEPEEGEYRWDLIDTALSVARERRQTLQLRIAPYGVGESEDVPAWFRAMVGSSGRPLPDAKWQVDPENPLYVKHFGGFTRLMGERYNGHPDLETVDMSIVSAWGEGESSHLLSEHTRAALADSYTDTFIDTPLVMLLTDPYTNQYGLTKANVGYRMDCLGDMTEGAAHMLDCYPQQIIQCGMQHAWKKGHVSFESCGVMYSWFHRGVDIDYVIDQSLKWHMSSFNPKSSPIPREWESQVNRWLRSMGYRFALRKWTYPDVVKPGGKLDFTSWWENLGVAPIYRRFPLAVRLVNERCSNVYLTDADIREWLPGDITYERSLDIPPDMPLGHYRLEVALVDRLTGEPGIRLASEGRQPDGWYAAGTVHVQTELDSPPSPIGEIVVSPWQ
ncbi:DUF4832 domain-containing protein [Paenibacillus sp. CF384]|uniref:DUF4832 domain-containing protein n=1 Tax=Paenibacillus sp. CF384 TaxID=1884382 RepID=UPI000896A04F|nr:DUF4832 domain-containing protein [Paenibacillus sp. CF384]SDW78295.1 Beta-galactosidase [Paenibacillus sp. CF384]